MPKWSLSSDFSLKHNPSSAWSYGSKPAGYHVSGVFSSFTHLDPEPNGNGIVGWFGIDNAWYIHGLGVYYNTKPTTVITGSVIFPGNSVAMHPSDDGRFSVVRFTAPKDENYVLDATFAHIDTCALHTGVYIIYNNLVTLWEIDLAGPEDSKSFKTTISVKAIEPIDFIVGVGLDNNYVCDTTLARVDIHLLDSLENQTGFPIIVGLIGCYYSAILYLLPDIVRIDKMLTSVTRSKTITIIAHIIKFKGKFFLL